MAEAKALQQLKSNRTTAKRMFSRLANKITRSCKNMSINELKDAFGKIAAEADKVIEANDDLELALVEAWDEDEETMKEEQRGDVKSTAEECEEKLEEVQKIIRDVIWTNFGHPELSLSLELAEGECYAASSAAPDINLEAYNFMLSQVEMRLKATKEAYIQWSQWAPEQEKADLQHRLKEAEICSAKLALRKAVLIQSKTEQEVIRMEAPCHQVPAIKLRPTALPSFDGCKRHFHSWKKDWEALQAQGEPTGSKEVRKFQLLDSLEEKVKKDLRLSTCGSSEEVFRMLENRFGNKTAIALEIVEELQALPAVKGHQPKRIVDLIRVVEKALHDLIELGDTGALKNPLMTKSLESKLPEVLKKEWLMFVAKKRDEEPSKDRFDMLLSFLKSQEGIYEELEQLRDEEPQRKESKVQQKHARTKATKAKSSQGACVVCGESGHKQKLYRCKKFRALSLEEKKEAVQQTGTCKDCLEVHEEGECKTTFLCRNECCRGRMKHHYFLCPSPGNKGPFKGKSKSSPSSQVVKKCTEDQEEFLTRLSPELAQQCRNVFCNTASRTLSSAASRQLLEKARLQEFPVIMMILEVTANAGQQLGTLIDLASDTNYITHDAANELNLQSEDVTLFVHGVGGMQVTVETKRYLLKIRVGTPKGTLRSHQLICYGLDSIAEIHHHVSPSKLQKIFPDIPLQELRRPTKIKLLISHKEGRLVPQKVRSVGDLVLWDGPLGKTVAGSHPDLFEKVDVTTHSSKTHFARCMRSAAVTYREVIHKSLDAPPEATLATTTNTSSDFLKWWKWDSIGAACDPKCGGCRCGKCQPGGKEMSLSEEKELEQIKGGLTYVTGDHHSNKPHWHARYPWTSDPAVLPNNKQAVQATFLRTERQLAKEPKWKEAYKSQVHDMVDRKAAVKLSDEMLSGWNGPVWYISHLVAPNPHSVTTPVRLVWNSSQVFKGQSLNNLLLKGPDVLNNIRAVLIRFRQGVHAALGDIRKMYNSVWLEDKEMHLHRFLWRDSEKDEVSEYAITRVNIGDKPAGCIAQVAMRETAGLPEFSHLKAERRVLEEDTYVDDILTSHNDWDQLQQITTNVDQILRAGGFKLKPWIYSGQSGREPPEDHKKELDSTVLVLPNQLSEEDNKALGMGYTPAPDEFHLMVSVNFSRRLKKMRLGKDLSKEEVRQHAPKPLTRRELLSQVSGLYDPLGLVTPIKQKGAILVRRAFQEVKGKYSRVESTWDAALSDSLREDAICLLEDYAEVKKLRFPRALTPPSATNPPYGITFSDGSEHSYGAVLYLRWSCQQETVIRLVESKAKLTPLDHKGDAVKAEVCGAVYAARLKKYFEKNCTIQVKKWFHLIDSQTVLGAVQRESYGYQTFFANRIGEIQSSTNIEDWLWIPGSVNIADIISRGARPDELSQGSEWQNGPEFLHLPESSWPVKSARELAATARENVIKLQKKAFVAVTARANAKLQSTENQEMHRPPAGIDISQLVDIKRFSNLQKLLRTITIIWRAAKRFLQVIQVKDNERSKWEAIKSSGVPTLHEREDAFRDLCVAAQSGYDFPNTTIERLVVYMDEANGLLLCGGRIQSFKKDQIGVPLIPPNCWLGVLLARQSHDEAHEGVAGTLLRMRKKAWIIQGRRLAQKTVNQCITCRKAKAKLCQQVMGDLPIERTEPAAPFQFIAVDMFGPYLVRDEVKRRVTMKVWGVVFSCMASRALHIELVNSMSAESFLMAYQRFAALRGHPQKVWSDPGTNFIGAKSVLEDLYKFLQAQNKTELEEYAIRNGTNWIWKVLPADSPHRNGAAEAAVRIAKRALQSLNKSNNLTFSEFLTALQLAANLANERPIDARIQSKEDCIQYVTPNTLLMGRAYHNGDVKTFSFENYSFKRLQEIEKQVNSFWQAWCQLAGPNLFIRSKWHTLQRNVAVGDIVWLCDQNSLRGQFRLGRVVAAVPDHKGVVRDVDILVAPGHSVPHSKQKKTFNGVVLHRDVRRLVVLLPAEEQTV